MQEQELRDESAISLRIKKQIDYYFGEANYYTDDYLRRQEDYEGWINIKIVLTFNKMLDLSKELNANPESSAYAFYATIACMNSLVVEFKLENGEFYVRKS